MATAPRLGSEKYRGARLQTGLPSAVAEITEDRHRDEDQTE